jgi:hypothetical protein
VGYYSGKIKGSLDYDISDSEGAAWYRSSWESDWRSALGFHGSIGVEYMLSRRLALLLEAQFRSVKLGDLNATMDSDSNLWPSYFYYDSSGTLYRWSWGEEGPMGLGYEELIVWQGTPPHSPQTFGGHAMGKAILDLTGYSMKIGIRIGLF